MDDLALDASAVTPPPFASLQPNGTIPTTNLTLPPLPAGWQLAGTVKWSGSITYSDNGRSIVSPTFTGTSSTWGALAIDFGSVAQVGKLVINVTAPIKRGDVTQPSYSIPFNSVISGINPAQADILARLGSIPLQVICFCESTLRQFDNTGMPVYHLDSSGGGGFGLMQLTNNPPPSNQDIMDWRQNIDDGKQKYAGLQTNATNHFNNLKATSPKLPAWTPAMLQAILYQLYNTGTNLNAWYYLPNSTGDGWTKNPNSNFTSYADKAVGYEAAVRNGNPPWGAVS